MASLVEFHITSSCSNMDNKGILRNFSPNIFQTHANCNGAMSGQGTEVFYFILRTFYRSKGTGTQYARHKWLTMFSSK